MTDINKSSEHPAPITDTTDVGFVPQLGDLSDAAGAARRDVSNVNVGIVLDVGKLPPQQEVVKKITNP